MEKHMVKDGVTGIVAKNEKEYVNTVQNLYKNKTLRNSLSKNARKYAEKNFSIDKMVKDWTKIFKEVLKIPKTRKKWKINKKNNDISAMDVFLESLGDYGEDFIHYRNAKSKDEKIKAMGKIIKLNESAIWKANTRGTVHHYNYFFPEDRHLSFLSRLMRDSGFDNNNKV